MTAAVAATENPISKSEFARRRSVSPGRVSQWIAGGKISKPALVGEGRDERVIESIAVAQLNQRLDSSQRFGNGLATRLDAPGAPAAPPQAEVLPFAAPPTAAGRQDAVTEQIAREKLEQIQRANRREALDEAADAGRLTDAMAAAQLAGRSAAQMVTVFEGALPEFAAALASKFEIPQRDALHLLRGEFRKVRATAAALLRRQAEDMPALVPIELDEQQSDDRPDHERRAAGDGSDGQGVGAAAAG